MPVVEFSPKKVRYLSFSKLMLRIGYFTVPSREGWGVEARFFRVSNLKSISRMKRSVLGLVVVLSVSIMGCQQGAKNVEAEGKDSSANVTVGGGNETGGGVAKTVVFPEGSVKIVWVNMDSLLTHYDYYFDLQREMSDMTGKSEKDLQTKGQSLERRVAAFQDKVQKGLMTRSEAQKEQESLQAEQGRFLQLQEQHRQQLLEEEQVRTRKVSEAISEFIKKYNATSGYDFILSGPMLYGSPALNVTEEVLKGLNEEYAAQKRNAAPSK